jgi:hypothetical protein
MTPLTLFRAASSMLMLLAACQGKAPTAQATGSVARLPASAQPPSSALPATSASANAPSASSSAPPPPPADVTPHCKAHGRAQTVSLGTLPDNQLQLRASGAWIYVLDHHANLARARWSRISRGGGKLTTIAERTALGDVSVVTEVGGAAYYTQAGKLVRLGPEPGASQVLHDGAQSPLAAHGESLFFVQCGNKGKADQLQELSMSGGAARTLAELEHASGRRCEYSSLVADAQEVVVADWRQQRILAVSRRDGTVQTIATKKGFPQDLILEPQAVAFLTARGFERVSRTGGDATRLLDNDHVAAPFSHAILRDGEYWLVDQLAYITTVHLFRLAYDGGKPKAVVTLKHKSPVDSTPGDEHLAGFTVDDQCAYFGRFRSGASSIELLALAK